jgi:thiol:disulfide interchange protein DsbD
MALTFTITSFTCTGPFLGPLLVAVKETNITFPERLLGCFVYSGTFAAPFFVLAIFPNLLKRLPKSGGWLNAVKVVMGFLELAAALKFLANTDLALNPGNPRLFSYDSVLCAWIALSLLCGLYLLGVFRLPHDSPVESLSVGRMILASIFLGLAVYMTPALWRVTPQGILGEGLVAFLPQDTRPPTSSGGDGGHPGELTWTRDYEAAWAQANREGKLLFVDFTGVNCTNCRYNEKVIFTLPRVREEMAKYVRVQLYTDNVPDPKLSFAESQRQGKRNLDLENGTFGDITLPLYAVIQPAADAPFEQTPEGLPRLKGTILGVRKGLIDKGMVEDFMTFLGEPLRRAERVARTNES